MRLLHLEPGFSEIKCVLASMMGSLPEAKMMCGQYYRLTLWFPERIYNGERRTEHLRSATAPPRLGALPMQGRQTTRRSFAYLALVLVCIAYRVSTCSIRGPSVEIFIAPLTDRTRSVNSIGSLLRQSCRIPRGEVFLPSRELQKLSARIWKTTI